jgi:hypothetical protein
VVSRHLFIVPPGVAASPFFSADPAVLAPCVLASRDEGIAPLAAGPVCPFFIMAPPPCVVPPFIEPPVVVWLAAGPPDCELPPAELPVWANAIVLEAANAAASAIVLIFMIRFLLLGAPVRQARAALLCSGLRQDHSAAGRGVFTL